MNDSGNYDIFEGLGGIVKGLETFAYASIKCRLGISKMPTILQIIF